MPYGGFGGYRATPYGYGGYNSPYNRPYYGGYNSYRQPNYGRGGRYWG